LQCGRHEALIPGLKNTERPKSIALRGESSDLFTNRKFSGFRSLCITPLSWHSCSIGFVHHDDDESMMIAEAGMALDE